MYMNTAGMWYVCQVCVWDQQRASASLELEFQLVVGSRMGIGSWELSLGPLREQQVLLTAQVSI